MSSTTHSPSTSTWSRAMFHTKRIPFAFSIPQSSDAAIWLNHRKNDEHINETGNYQERLTVQLLQWFHGFTFRCGEGNLGNRILRSTMIFLDFLEEKPVPKRKHQLQLLHWLATVWYMYIYTFMACKTIIGLMSDKSEHRFFPGHPCRLESWHNSNCKGKHIIYIYIIYTLGN